MEDIRPGRVPLPPDKRYQERGSSCLPVFGAVLWALAEVTRRPCKFERALTIEVLSSTRFLEPAASGRGLTQRVTAAVRRKRYRPAMHDWGVMDWLTAIITVAVILGIVVLSYRRR